MCLCSYHEIATVFIFFWRGGDTKDGEVPPAAPSMAVSLANVEGSIVPSGNRLDSGFMSLE